MNVTVIILGVVLVILVYVLYKYYMVGSTTLSTNASLKIANPPITSLTEPKSVRYAYGIWIYVNTWDSTIQKVIFNRANNITLYLDKLTPSLKCDVAMNDNTKKTILITDNFPLQKWVHIIVSFDNQFADAYLDGKLVKSQRVYDKGSATTSPSMPAIPPDSTSPVILGGNNFDATVTKFNRWTKPMDPQTAWNEYMSGNGQGYLSKSPSTLSAKLAFFKDNVEYSKYSVF